LLDTLGCALAGRAEAPVHALEALLGARDAGRVELPGGPSLATAAATQVLAMAATWHEACEGHAGAHGRPGVPIVAALVPLALARDASLAAVLDALVTGYEVGARAGAWLRIRPRMHVDGNWPALGVAAGVARLLGLDATACACAVDVAACQLPTSLYLPVTAGCTARNTYLGHAATLGIDAAYAAAAGIDAPGDAAAHYAEHFSAAAQTAPVDADGEWILDAYLKPFAAVRHVHYGATAARALRARLGGVTRDIRRLRLSIYQEAVTYCGNRAPHTVIQGQFSLSFGLAAMLCFGDLGPDAYAPGRFDDAELRRLESLVEIAIDPQLTREGRRGATLVLDRGAGEASETVGVIPGDPQCPLDDAQVAAKFVRYASGGRLDAAAAARFAQALLHGPADAALRSLWALLVS